MDVRVRAQRPRRHRRHGPVRDERVLCLLALVGRAARPIRRAPRKWPQSDPIRATHDSLVRLQIVAVILCNTGIALLAYMDGITRSPTLGGVMLAATASAGSAVYKVTFSFNL